MARVNAETVIRLDSDGDTIPEILETSGIKVIATGVVTVRLRSGNSVAGPVMWEHVFAATGETYDPVEIKSKSPDGTYLEVAGAGTAIVYIYNR